MAACALADSGLKVLILDAANLPRPKPCGGAMPSAVRRVIPWDFDALVENRVPRVRNQFNFEQTHDFSSEGAPILMVNRARFDLYWIERALDAGRGNVELRDEFRVVAVEEDENGVTLRGGGGDMVRASYVVAADGAYSKTARMLGLNRGAILGAAMDAEVEVTPEVYEAERERATFNFFCLPNGYGWIFPKDGYLSCGVGAWRNATHLPAALNAYLERSLPPGSIRARRTLGHAIPLYSGRRTIATRRVCLAGDAASLVDPILGEGIRFAMLSGRLAADTIRALMQVPVTNPASELVAPAPLNAGPEDRSAELPAPGDGGGRGEEPPGLGDLRDYQTMVWRTMGAPLGNLSRFVSPLFLRAPGFFYRKFIVERENYFGLSQALARRTRGGEADI
jgi:geranylgeranyl reductase family protein